MRAPISHGQRPLFLRVPPRRKRRARGGGSRGIVPGGKNNLPTHWPILFTFQDLRQKNWGKCNLPSRLFQPCYLSHFAGAVAWGAKTPKNRDASSCWYDKTAEFPRPRLGGGW